MGKSIRVKDNVHERFTWSVSQLDVQSTDQILEIGCGHGIAVALICDKLMEGGITAIDRSAKMIAVAKCRNAAYVASDRAAFHTIALKDADFDAALFNKIFAINVNVFWQNPHQELIGIRQLLREDGRLFLCYQPPTTEKANVIIEKVQENLIAAKYAVIETRTQQVGTDALLTLTIAAPQIATKLIGDRA